YLAVLPIVEGYAPLACRGLKCPHRRDDAMQELRGVTWQWLLRHAANDRDGTAFIRSLAYLAAQWVRSHRKITHSERAKDVLSPLATARHSFKVDSLPSSNRRCHEDRHTGNGQRQLDTYEERFQNNLRSTPAEQVMFKLDFKDWRASHADRDRRIIDDMAQDE